LSSEDTVSKTDEEWKETLTPEQYNVCRNKDTERPFTGKYNDCKDKGVYKCSCCGNELFDSDAKFESGTGWPSFYKPINDENVKNESDSTFGMVRTEVMCKKCGAHLGHVFDDGPQPTNLRYCINSVSLDLDKKTE
jgi:peptide-methionine (R)-S-oxide reductase